MKFLLDMGLAESTARFLRAGGNDASHLREENLHRLSDEAIIAKAVEEDRIVLTHDLDFGRIVALSGQRLPSVITFRLSDMRAENVNRYISDILTRFSGDLSNGALISVQDHAIRVRRLPLR